jgi:predicted nucleic acid-binding protein
VKLPAPLVVYLDSSALLRLLYSGPDAAPIDDAVATSSTLVEVETHRAIERNRFTGRIDDLDLARKRGELDDLLRKVHLFPVSEEVIARARAPAPIAVIAVHAVHVATASLVAEEAQRFQFWTHDAQQAAAAIHAGHDVRGVDLGGH